MQLFLSSTSRLFVASLISAAMLIVSPSAFAQDSAAQALDKISISALGLVVSDVSVAKDGRFIVTVASANKVDSLNCAASASHVIAQTATAVVVSCTDNRFDCANGTAVTNSADCSNCGGGSAGNCGQCCDALAPSPNANLNCKNLC